MATLGNAELLRLDLVIPRWGPWHGDLQLVGTTAPGVGEQVTLSIGTVSRVGTVIRSGAPYAQPRIRIVGGKNKLGVMLKPADYGQVTLAQVVGDILSQAGERAGNLDVLQSIVVPQYQLCQETARQALQAALRLAGGLDLWCEHDGSLSVRQTQWASSVSALYRGIVPQENGVELFGENGDIELGVTVATVQGNFNVERVQYILNPDDGRSNLLVRAWYV